MSRVCLSASIGEAPRKLVTACHRVSTFCKRLLPKSLIGTRRLAVERPDQAGYLSRSVLDM